MRTHCPLCGHGELSGMLDRAAVPVLQNLHYPSAEAARAAPKGNLAIRICRRCGFGFNAAFAPELAVYGPGYENDQAGSPAFARHLAGRAGRIAALLPRSRATLLEVGCGQASFLRLAVAAAEGRIARAIGYDPAWRGGDTQAPIAIRPRILTAAEKSELAPVDAIVTRHVVEHVDDPLGFLALLRAMADAPTTLAIETPCLRWILAQRALHDVFYEHCNYFTAETLRFALERAGFAVAGVSHMFGGQYLWAEARPRTAGEATMVSAAAVAELMTAATAFATQVDSGMTYAKRVIGNESDVALWGAGAKGATLATTLDPDGTLISCLIDINPRKQGRYIAGSGHAIVSPAAAAARGVRRIAIMNPNYREEIMAEVERRELPFRPMSLEMPT